MTQRILDAEPFVKVTYIDVLCQQFVGHSVLVEDVIVGDCTCQGGAEEESEHSVGRRAAVSSRCS